MGLIDEKSYEIKELWDQYRNDPRPFPQICKEHYLTTTTVYDAFDRAGYPWRLIKHPMTCIHCGRVFLPDDPQQRYCCIACRKVSTRKRTISSSIDHKLIERKEKAKSKDIIMIAAEAKAHGMSYGRYVAYLEGS